VNTEIHLDTPLNKLPEAAKDTIQKLSSKLEEGVENTKDYAQHAVEVTKDAAHRVTDSAKDVYHSAAQKSGDCLATSKDYMRQNPVPVLLGALALGAAIGYIIMSNRRKPTFGERFADQPMDSVRDAILTAFAPVSQRVHDGYDSARDGVEKVLERAHHFGSGRHSDSMSDRISRVGSNLKFW
jgi:ElaB/YqjD/DUF883 family membrane-anchored ribosome-binding protein